MALANIQTSVVGTGQAGDNQVKLSGTIVENEESNAVQVSYFSGRIEELNVSFTGEQVKQGQLLATVYSPELYAAQQELITASALRESQPSLYAAVRNKLKLWKLSDSQIEQIESTGKVMENFPIYATVSGTVAEKLVEQGDYVKEGQPLMRITRLNTVWAQFDVYESQIDLFRKGQEITVTTNAYSDQEFRGKVAFIDPMLNPRTRTVKLRVVLDNRNQILKPGMFVEAKVQGISTVEEERLLIPASAVLWTGERSVVYVQTNPEQPVFEMREVKLGAALGESYEVISGLSSGEAIVTNGTFTIDASAQLQGKKSMMNKQGLLSFLPSSSTTFIIIFISCFPFLRLFASFIYHASSPLLVSFASLLLFLSVHSASCISLRGAEHTNTMTKRTTPLSQLPSPPHPHTCLHLLLPLLLLLLI